MTEGLLAEVMAEAERFDAGDPSVLTADKVCKIGALWVSLNILIFDTIESCRKPAPFGKGRARMPDIERPEFKHGCL